MSSGQWEVVGKKSKGSSKASINNAEKEENQSAEKGLKSGTNIPLPSEEEAYKNLQKFKIETSKPSSKKENNSNKNSGTTPAPLAKTTQKSSLKKNASSKPKTLKEAVTKLNLSEFQTLSKVLKKQYQDNPLVWLKDLASFLNIRLNPSTPVDSAYRQEGANNGPLDYLALPVREFLVMVLQSVDVDVLSLLHRHCFTSMLHESIRGLPVHGYAIFIQLLGSVCHAASVTYDDDYVSVRMMYDGHPRSGLTYVWLLSNTISAAVNGKYYASAVKMYMDGLIPLLGSKHYSSLVASCGKDMSVKLMSLNDVSAQDKKKSGGESTIHTVVTADHVLTLLDTIYSSNTQLPKTIVKQITDILNRLRVVCTLPSIQGSARESVQLLQRVLPKLSTSTAPALSRQFMITFASCLECNESGCLEVWLEMLQRHYLQSGSMISLLCADEEYSRVLCTPPANKALKQIAEQTSSVSDDHYADQCNEEVRKALGSLTVGSGRRSKGSSGGNRREGGGTWFGSLCRTIFWVIVISYSLGFYAVSLDNSKAKFDRSVVGKLASSFGVTQEARVGVHRLAVLSNNTAVLIGDLKKSSVEVLTPVAASVQVKYGEAQRWLSARAPTASQKASELLLEGRRLVLVCLDTARELLTSAANSESVKNLQRSFQSFWKSK